MTIVGLSAWLSAAEPAAAANPCAPSAGHEGYTLLLEEDGHFVDCRGGEETEYSPLSGERVVLQLPKVSSRAPFRFRLVRPSSMGNPSGDPIFRRQLDRVEALEQLLEELENAPESVSESIGHLEPGELEAGPSSSASPATSRRSDRVYDRPIPEAPGGQSDSEALQKAEAARAKYLAIATAQFDDAVRGLRPLLRQVAVGARESGLVCRVLEASPLEGPVRESIERKCAGGGPGAKLLAELKPFEDDLESFLAARKQAREAVLDLGLTPINASQQDAAAKRAAAALDAGREAADALVHRAGLSAKQVAAFGAELSFLRMAVTAPRALREGQRIVLGRFPAPAVFGTADIYEVSVSREINPFFGELGNDEGGKALGSELLADRFQPVPRHYLDLELGLVFSVGLPQHPIIAGPSANPVLKSAQTGGAAGAVVVSLEPLRFINQENPLAGILRFPLVAIPFTLDPLSNFMVGAGLGWEDIGSIDFGAHLAFVRIPGPGYDYGSPVAPNTGFRQVTEAGPLAAGFFFGLSVDPLGLIHRLFELRAPAVREALTGMPVTASAPERSSGD